MIKASDDIGEHAATAGKVRPDRKEVVISISGLTKSFGANAVLKGIDVDLFEGENLAVLGRSGSGKSVLIKIIAGLLTADGGSVEVLHQPVGKLNYKALQLMRTKIGFSFQGSALYDSMSVRQNLEFPLIRTRPDLSRKQIREAAVEVLTNVGLPETLEQMPSELSGGQRKRVGVARTLILKPAIMLYDEPTSGLDPITCREINELILKVQKDYKTTSIIITHDLTCAKSVAQRVGMIEDGRFLKLGTFDEVFRSDDSFSDRFYNYNFIQ